MPPQRQIDAETARAAQGLRAAGVAWKVLERRFGCAKSTLYRAIRRLALYERHSQAEGHSTMREKALRNVLGLDIGKSPHLACPANQDAPRRRAGKRGPKRWVES